ncbi:hypothetical protein [Polycladidibacter hongkongensis]|uniref:hypothetical protein n=1 Tax=Polycladidibacter hongkongensis TaxID=1647556 RepID=UPI0008310DF3|nr:hypothetical protein [Pseudovibrio hongkongensis]
MTTEVSTLMHEFLHAQLEAKFAYVDKMRAEFQHKENEIFNEAFAAGVLSEYDNFDRIVEQAIDLYESTRPDLARKRLRQLVCDSRKRAFDKLQRAHDLRYTEEDDAG